MHSKCLYNSSITVHQGWYVIVLLYKAFKCVVDVSGITAGGWEAECPLTPLTGKFLLPYWKRGGRKKGKMEKKEGK